MTAQGSRITARRISPWLVHGLVVFLILIVAFLPVISVAIAGGIATANGCALDEGSIHPCVVNGQDIGSTLYTMGMLGWFMIATLPLGLAAVILYAAVVIGFTIVRKAMARRKAA